MTFRASPREQQVGMMSGADTENSVDSNTRVPKDDSAVGRILNPTSTSACLPWIGQLPGSRMPNRPSYI